jgi:hypothetical protein
MDGRPGWLVGARHPDSSLIRFSDIKFLTGFYYLKLVLRWPVIGIERVGSCYASRYRSLMVNC